MEARREPRRSLACLGRRRPTTASSPGCGSSCAGGSARPRASTLRAVRAVDTATHPDHQGKGIFTKLTLGAIPDLRDDGVDAIFNTPNDKSRPGYLKMGWSQVGRVPVGVRVASPRSLRRALGARTAAEMWSRPSDVGDPAPDVLADDAGLQRLLDACASVGADRDRPDRRAPAVALPVRAAALPGGAHRPRARRRRGDPAAARTGRRARGRGVRGARARAVAGAAGDRDGSSARRGADYLLRCGGPSILRDGFVPAPQLGPILTWKPICRTGAPSMSRARADARGRRAVLIASAAAGGHADDGRARRDVVEHHGPGAHACAVADACSPG